MNNKKILALLAVALFAFLCPFLLAVPFIGIMGMATSQEGFLAKGHIQSGQMKSGVTITKGYGVYKNTNGYIDLAPANTNLCIGVALETKTAGASAHPLVNFCMHGKVTAHMLSTGDDLVPGDAIAVSATAGKFRKFLDGTDTVMDKVGRSLENKDVSEVQACEVWFCP